MKRRRGPVWRSALVAALLAHAPALAAERVALEFEINDLRHMIVAIEVNGVAGSFAVVDTAATFTMIDSRTARQGGIPAPVPGTREVNILGLNGERVYPVVRVDTVTAGGFRIEAMDAAWSNDLDIPGSAPNILPASALPGDVLEFDFRKGQILAYDGRPHRRSAEQSERVDYDLVDGLMFIDVRLNGRTGRALIDTGSNLTYVNSAFAEHANVYRDRERTQQLLGATGDSAPVWIATAKKLAISDFSLSRLDLLVSDPFLFDQLGLADEPVMVIGIDILSQFRVQIDRPRQQIVLGLPAYLVGGVRTGSAVSASRIGN